MALLIKEALPIEKSIVEKIEELQKNGCNTSRFIRTDFSELTIMKKGVHPKLLAANLKTLIKEYDPEQATAIRDLQLLIDELEVAAEIEADIHGGVSNITRIHALQSSGEIRGTFVVHRYRRQSSRLVVDALVISCAQKMSVDWLAFAMEGAAVAAIGFLINPALGIEEVVGLLVGGIHLFVNYQHIKASQKDDTAKALLLKVLVDKGLGSIENSKFYLTLD